MKLLERADSWEKTQRVQGSLLALRNVARAVRELEETAAKSGGTVHE